ncbi:DUF4352 domain-containing protein [Alteribacter natronophilus]|uniref:DUF4352 domain-containing protein n=1 Tax=Alteribacter natronophilus TaxID=2583810 RepID=UPI00110E1159|nr:DUF4352 domain-containing protein [Alteribacter natronophilus]TMW71148.1 DUF4352 domain-containing protein [Alteribacter natronophilus]
MKKAVLTAALSSTLVLAACGDDEPAGVTTEDNGADVLEDEEEEPVDVEDEDEEDAQDGDAGEEDDEEDADAEDDSGADDSEAGIAEDEEQDEQDDLDAEEWETQVGETVENEGGSFTLVNRLDGIEPMESGPIILNIDQINVTSAQFEGDLADFMETDEADYIQVDMRVENTSDEDLTFYASQATLVTNTGEQLESDMWMSDHIPGDIMSGVTASGSVFYVLENSDAEDIEWVRLVWSAPFDEDWEDVGEEIDEQFELD